MRAGSVTTVRELSLALFPDAVNLHNACAGGVDVAGGATVCLTAQPLQRCYTKQLKSHSVTCTVLQDIFRNYSRS